MTVRSVVVPPSVITAGSWSFSYLLAASRTGSRIAERSSRLDSKAGNYLGNVGVVLSILSLIPVLTVVLGLDGQQVFSGGWPVFIAIVIFGYAVLALLLSAYYSSKALKMRAYRVYFDAGTMRDWIDSDDMDDEEILVNLLECQRNNEIHNLEKNNAISVAGTFFSERNN